MMEIFQFLAALTAVLFTGAAIYINLVEHPARMECGTELAATVFGPSYKRAARMQVILALTATAAGILVWLTGGGMMWLVGAFFIFAVVPFTLIIIMPVNNKLLDPGSDRASTVTRDLLRTWGKLHAVRSILSLVASIIFLRLLIRA
jgi:uncharacterized membrane protein